MFQEWMKVGKMVFGVELKDWNSQQWGPLDISDERKVVHHEKNGGYRHVSLDWVDLSTLLWTGDRKERSGKVERHEETEDIKGTVSRP